MTELSLMKQCYAALVVSVVILIYCIKPIECLILAHRQYLEIQLTN